MLKINNTQSHCTAYVVQRTWKLLLLLHCELCDLLKLSISLLILDIAIDLRARITRFLFLYMRSAQPKIAQTKEERKKQNWILCCCLIIILKLKLFINLVVVANICEAVSSVFMCVPISSHVLFSFSSSYLASLTNNFHDQIWQRDLFPIISITNIKSVSSFYGFCGL